jgi:hypothetical protein
MSGGIFNPLGIEPSTHHVLGDRAARERGEMIWLHHYESRSYDVMLQVLDGADEIASAEARIKSIARHERWVPPTVRPISGSRRQGAMNGQVVAPARRVEI